MFYEKKKIDISNKMLLQYVIKIATDYFLQRYYFKNAFNCKRDQHKCNLKSNVRN